MIECSGFILQVTLERIQRGIPELADLFELSDDGLDSRPSPRGELINPLAAGFLHFDQARLAQNPGMLEYGGTADFEARGKVAGAMGPLRKAPQQLSAAGIAERAHGEIDGHEGHVT
jgi:hypothetical protein